jgi:hypothetical protein
MAPGFWLLTNRAEAQINLVDGATTFVAARLAKSALVERVCTAHSAVFSDALIAAVPHGPYTATTERRSCGR